METFNVRQRINVEERVRVLARTFRSMNHHEGAARSNTDCPQTTPQDHKPTCVKLRNGLIFHPKNEKKATGKAPKNKPQTDPQAANPMMTLVETHLFVVVEAIVSTPSTIGHFLAAMAMQSQLLGMYRL